MSKKPQRPIPDDFATWAIYKTQPEIRAHYDCGSSPQQRWLQSMPDDWKAQRKDFFHAKNADRYKELAVKGAKASAGRLAIPMPEGFAEAAATVTRVQLAAQFNIGTTTVHRLIKQLSP